MIKRGQRGGYQEGRWRSCLIQMLYGYLCMLLCYYLKSGVIIISRAIPSRSEIHDQPRRNLLQVASIDPYIPSLPAFPSPHIRSSSRDSLPDENIHIRRQPLPRLDTHPLRPRGIEMHDPSEQCRGNAGDVRRFRRG